MNQNPLLLPADYTSLELPGRL